MVALAKCPSCQWGDHEGHNPNWKPAPPGVMGGFYCNCPGDCRDDMSDIITGMLKSLTDPINPDEPNRSCIQ